VVKPKKKRAVFYLLMSVTLMGIIVSSMLVFSNRFKKLESSSIEIVGNEFVGATITDMSTYGLDNFMEVASKKALEALASYMALEFPVNNTAEAFDSLVTNGSLNGSMRYLTPTLVKFLGVTTNYYFVLGFSIDKINIDSKFEHTDPWTILVTSNITYKVNVPRARFTGVIGDIKKTNVSIFGLPEPVGGWRVTSQWKHNTSFPSYVDMLEGKTAGSAYGICREC
jgi:hypothetical protein